MLGYCQLDPWEYTSYSYSNQNIQIFIQVNAFENAVCEIAPSCLNLIVLKAFNMHGRITCFYSTITLVCGFRKHAPKETRTWISHNRIYPILGKEYWHMLDIWVRSRNCGCLVTWFCYQLIAKPGNKTAAVSWPHPYVYVFHLVKIWTGLNLFNNDTCMSVEKY